MLPLFSQPGRQTESVNSKVDARLIFIQPSPSMEAIDRFQVVDSPLVATWLPGTEVRQASQDAGPFRSHGEPRA